MRLLSAALLVCLASALGLGTALAKDEAKSEPVAVEVMLDAGKDPELARVLDNTEKTYSKTKDFKADFELIEEDLVFERTSRKKGTIAVILGSPELFRMEFTAPYEKLWLANRDWFVQYIPSNSWVWRKHRAMEAERGMGRGTDALFDVFSSTKKVRENFDIKLAETIEKDPDDGKKYYKLELIPRTSEQDEGDVGDEDLGSEYEKMEWWIEEDRWIPARLKFYETDKTLMFTFTRLKLNSNLKESFFDQPDYPPNTEIETAD